MLFNSLEYVLFLCLTFLAYWALARLRLLRILFLLVASYLFYMSWNPVYLLLILASTGLDYFCGRAMTRTTEPRRRKLFLIASLTGNLSLLGYFKYTNFFWTSSLGLANLLGLDVSSLPPHFEILLPAGISFYTFASMSYSLDIYRGHVQPAKNLHEFAFYVAFFPQLVAGPIVRAREFLPQLEQPPRLSARDASDGLFLILKGMLKKVVIADYLAVNLVDRVYDNPGWYSSPEVLLAVFAYSLQIYYDFSAYTDIARGSARLFGFELPENFQRPYQAQDVAEFWQRWHMTLTRWIRDYLYISLGGSRGGRWLTYRNLLITWLLMGLWHGANWTFVLWGAFYAVVLILNHLRRPDGKRRERAPGWRGVVRTGLTILITTAAWIPFRATDFGQLTAVLRRLAEGGWGVGQLTPTLWLIFGLGWGLHLTPQAWVDRSRALFDRIPAPVQAGLAAAVAALLLRLGETMPVPFIYFQF